MVAVIQMTSRLLLVLALVAISFAQYGEELPNMDNKSTRNCNPMENSAKMFPSFSYPPSKRLTYSPMGLPGKSRIFPPVHPKPMKPLTYQPPVRFPTKTPTISPTFESKKPITHPANSSIPPKNPAHVVKPTSSPQIDSGLADPDNIGFDTCVRNHHKVFCRQIVWWDKKSREQPAVQLSPPSVQARVLFAEASLQQSDVTNFPTDRAQCMDISCICRFARGTYFANRCYLSRNRIYGKAVRKEFRMMTDAERTRFRNAMWGIRTTQYLDLSRIHSSYVTSPGAHSGPAFLPWHREFLKRLEIALRQYDPDVALPYWDSTLDAALDDPVASVMWSDELMGSTDAMGTLNTGLFAYWQAHLNHTTRRRYGGVRNSRPTAQSGFDRVQTQVITITDALAFTAASRSCPSYLTPPTNAIEYIHGTNHVWVGGDMYLTTESTNDPLFFLHHSMVDFVWETWRLTKQSRGQRETAYPVNNVNCSGQSHFSRTVMVPFTPMVNLDGLSNKYTDNLYQYDPRPSCSSTNRNCGSRFLFCHGTLFVCVSRIRAGFPCDSSRYGDVDPCYGTCVNRICQATRRLSSARVLAASPRRGPQDRERVTHDETCFNQNPCCGAWAAKGGCRRDSLRMRIVCSASCQWCKPSTYTLNDDCKDRHPLCDYLKKDGKCISNMKFMSENCRRTCSLCAKSRNVGCLRHIR